MIWRPFVTSRDHFDSPPNFATQPRRVSGLTGSCVDGPYFARGNVAADVRRSGADMCPACSTRHAWPLALMRSADQGPINFARSKRRPVCGMSQSSVTTECSSASRHPRDQGCQALPPGSPILSARSGDGPACGTPPGGPSPPRQSWPSCWRPPTRPAGTVGDRAAR